MNLKSKSLQFVANDAVANESDEVELVGAAPYPAVDVDSDDVLAEKSSDDDEDTELGVAFAGGSIHWPVTSLHSTTSLMMCP